MYAFQWSIVLSLVGIVVLAGVLAKGRQCELKKEQVKRE